MPFVRISLKKGKGVEFKKSVSHSIHQALVESFGIPEDDFFQVIDEHDEENIIFPSSYMGIKHTSDIIYVVIVLKAGRSVELKKFLYKSIVDNISKKTDHGENDIVIALTENNEEDWSFGNGEAQLI
ncbi:MAG: tautomerase family protein [Gammaproteobacteria bacterium]